MRMMEPFFFLFALILSVSTSAKATFSTKTKIFWSLAITKDGKKEVYEEDKINAIKTINYNKLGITCSPPLLKKEHIKYHPKKNKGYTRDEESSQIICQIKETKLTSGPVVCAKGYAKNGVGNIYVDSEQISLLKTNSSFSIALKCLLK